MTDLWGTVWQRFEDYTAFDEGTKTQIAGVLHPEIRAGFSVIAGVAHAETARILGTLPFPELNPYLSYAASALPAAVTDGFMLNRISRGINPFTPTPNREKLRRIGHEWTERFRHGTLDGMVAALPPPIRMMLRTTGEAHVNLCLIVHPESANLPYKTIGDVHNRIMWAVAQGFVLGEIERELTAP